VVVAALWTSLLPFVWAAQAEGSVPPPDSAGQEAADAERIVVPARGSLLAPSDDGPRGQGQLTSRRFNFEQFRTRLEGHWFKRKALLKQGHAELAESELKRIEEVSREAGVGRITALGAALVHEGDEFLREGSFEKARASYTGALLVSPGFPPAHRGLARAAWRSGEGLASAGGHWIAAAASGIQEGWFSFRILANALVIGLFAGALALAGFSCLLVLKYQRALRHDVNELLRGRLRAPVAEITGFAVLLAPLLTWVLAPLTPVYWLAVLFRYCTPRERAVSAVLLVLLAISGPAAILSRTVSRVASDPTARVLVETAGPSNQPETILALEELASSDPAEPLYPELLGQAYARGRFLQEAMSQYLRAAELAPANPRPLNNIGNLYFEVGRHGEACQAYLRALEIDRSFLPPYVNLYLARQATFDFRHAEEALQNGRQVDAKKMAALLESQTKDGRAQGPVESGVPPSEIWRRILSRGSAQGDLLALASAGMKSTASLSGVAAILLALLLSAILGTTPARVCMRCGRPFCALCQKTTEAPDHCLQCWHLESKRDGVHPSVRLEKIGEIAQHGRREARVARWTSLLLPGASRVLGGRTLTGAGSLALWCLLLSTLLLHGRLLAPTLPAPAGTTVTIPGAALAGVLWLAANMPRRARTGGG